MSTLDRASLVKSALLHLTIVIALLVSFDFRAAPKQLAVSEAGNQVEIIDAKFIDSNVLAEQKRAKQQAEAQARAEQLQRKRAEEKKAAERRQRIEREKRKKAAERERKRKETEAQQAKERQRQAEIKRQQEEAKRLEQERAAQQKAREVAEQKRQEEAAKAQAQAKRVLSETDKYIGLIKQTIQRNLIFEEGSSKKECRLNIRLSQTGLVFDVKILRGDPALCRAARTAVLKPDSLPVSSDPLVYAKLRDFNLTVEL